MLLTNRLENLYTQTSFQEKEAMWKKRLCENGDRNWNKPRSIIPPAFPVEKSRS